MLVEKREFWPDFYKLWNRLGECEYWNENLAYNGEATASKVRPPQSPLEPTVGLPHTL
jgi:hypothetical protein